MGLPGSGKTYLAERLVPILNAAWYNADKLREMANDWDFSDEGRRRQSRRMRTFADFEKDNDRYVVCDFVCPTKETRENFDADIVIWMDTLQKVDLRIQIRSLFLQSRSIFILLSGMIITTQTSLRRYLKVFDWKKPTVQMLGRWQPWHKGHQELFKRCVKKTGQVMIQVRDQSSGGDGQDDNPFDWDLVCKNIEEGLASDGFKRGVEYEIMLVPNIVNISYGRGVGYVFEEEVFDDSVSEISATKIRKQMRDEGDL